MAEAITEPSQPHILIVQALFYRDIAEELRQGAVKAIERAQASHDTINVPGSFEIPAAIGFAVEAGRSGRSRLIDGFVALGCVIRGETSHYDYVCSESARGIMMLAVNFNVAIGYGILTVENEDQAWARARVSEGNKGGMAAEACLSMVGLKASLGFLP